MMKRTEARRMIWGKAMARMIRRMNLLRMGSGGDKVEIVDIYF